MYCVACGSPVSSRFCPDCGTPVAAAAGPARAVPPPPPPPPVPTPRVAPRGPAVDWISTLDYDVVSEVPEVRAAVQAAAGRSRTRLSGEQMLEGLGTLLDLVGLDGRMMSAGVQIGPLLAATGMATGKTRTGSFAMPPGVVLAGALVSLAQRGMPIEAGFRAARGSAIKAALPVDVWTWKGGTMLAAFDSAPGGVVVTAATEVPGQLYDWGKSKRVLDTFFADIASAGQLFPPSMNAGPAYVG